MAEEVAPGRAREAYNELVYELGELVGRAAYFVWLEMCFPEPDFDRRLPGAMKLSRKIARRLDEEGMLRSEGPRIRLVHRASTGAAVLDLPMDGAIAGQAMKALAEVGFDLIPLSTLAGPARAASGAGEKRTAWEVVHSAHAERRRVVVREPLLGERVGHVIAISDNDFTLGDDADRRITVPFDRDPDVDFA